MHDEIDSDQCTCILHTRKGKVIAVQILEAMNVKRTKQFWDFRIGYEEVGK
jgi:uncharacterized protein YuzE